LPKFVYLIETYNNFTPQLLNYIDLQWVFKKICAGYAGFKNLRILDPGKCAVLKKVTLPFLINAQCLKRLFLT